MFYSVRSNSRKFLKARCDRRKSYGGNWIYPRVIVNQYIYKQGGAGEQTTTLLSGNLTQSIPKKSSGLFHKELFPIIDQIDL